MPQYAVTGCAGFIGSNLVSRLLADGHEVIGIDNFSTGRREFLSAAIKSPAFTLVEGDLLDTTTMDKALKGRSVSMVFHLAANADVSSGVLHPRRDLEQNTIATHNVLEGMRSHDVSRIVFSSTGSIYGEPDVFPTPEDAPFPIQTSFYGASKLAGEGLIASFCEAFGFQAWIYRFVSVLGEGYTHGHVFDFYRKLQTDPNRIEVLGDGNQQKSYMYIGDCLDGILLGVEKGTAPVNIFNLGLDDTIKVHDSLALIVDRLGLSPKVDYTGGKRGWVGDSPLIHLDCTRIRKLGWKPARSIDQGVLCTLDWLRDNPWVFEGRE
ncbi:MAG: NAD-dependent epimerase/dehydratase family protein [Rhodospirillales bacterium]|jgi:UDP-glucose 4-epimerase|nr:NAD-dependent epimerase/dehydratase family protein [Rhodospirillales bacterium]MBT4006525.1 NAD-dependent epimerase/dehydratase family protein [Rhodospirillales bacterium]MBT5076756.1 NAD-dependent epimerase/dehydratase family protein [Rhodospirillales bacterium]MBT5113803.1 NAD-dependent epimerase/dehydratase family protein [Rhodospirillales bacterium]MBT5672331.1 NAD-dependent epimerase/dehydratase family protein [Rhodospirillales bacterium]